MVWFAAASGKRGRSPKFSDVAIQFCLTLKNLFGLALRQTTGLVESVLQLCGLAWPVPDFSTLCRRQRDLNVQIPYSPSKAGLHLLVDSTGIKFLGEGEWKCKKHSAEHGRGLGRLASNLIYATTPVVLEPATGRAVTAFPDTPLAQVNYKPIKK